MPVDSNRVPYIVIPGVGPPGSPASEFIRSTGIERGDLGVVLFGGRVAPVIVADIGPLNKLGEGSMALQRALGIEFCTARDAAQNCTSARHGSSIPGGVMTIVFPGTRPTGLTLDNIVSVVDHQAQAYYDQLVRAYPSTHAGEQ